MRTLVDLNLTKISPTPWLTESEARLLRDLREGGRISIFRIGKCEACDGDVPKGTHKRFCSKKCYESIHGDSKNEEDETEAW